MARTAEVLIVDDEEIVVERLRNYMEKKGMAVETCTVSRQAIERIKEKRFDVIVTDIKMEGPSGIDLMVVVKAESPASEVILITGYGTYEAQRQAEAVGAYDFIHKPFKVEDLHKKVVKAASRARRRAK
jgi:DNA-binding NtrC family response regulator